MQDDKLSIEKREREREKEKKEYFFVHLFVRRARIVINAFTPQNLAVPQLASSARYGEGKRAHSHTCI